MQFAEPLFLWLALGLLPALAVFLFWTWRRRQALIRQFVSIRLLPTLLVGVSYQRQKLRMILFLAAVAMLLLALARPQYGFEWEEARQRGLDIVVVVDVSRSMMAEDVKPNRLERAKLAAQDLALIVRSDRLALVPFAGTAFLQCPLTLDAGTFIESVRSLDAKTIPLDGTAIPAAIETALAVFPKDHANEKALVILTDGENHEGDASAAAEKAAKAGMRVFTVGVGTAGGELIPLRDTQNRISYHRDSDGNVVKTRLAESALQQIATAGNGFYLPLQGANTMEVLYRRGLEPMPKSEHSSQRLRRFHERYAWPLGLAIVFLLAEMVVPERKRRMAESAPAKAPAIQPGPTDAI